MWPGRPASSSRRTPSAARAAGAVVAAGHEHDDLGAASPSRSASAAIAPARDGARAALGDGEHARAPALLGRARAAWARATITLAPPSSVDAELRAAREQLVAVGELAAEHGVQERGGGLLRGALGRAHALDLGGDSVVTSRSTSAAPGSARARMPQLADDRVGDAQLDAARRRRAPSSSERSLGRRARGDGEHRAPCGRSATRLASSARAAARTTSGSPAPDSTASVIASRRERDRAP